jgi:hypothetical protein
VAVGKIGQARHVNKASTHQSHSIPCGRHLPAKHCIDGWLREGRLQIALKIFHTNSNRAADG